MTLIDPTESRSETAALEEARRARDLLLLDAGVGTWRFNPDAAIYRFSPELTGDLAPQVSDIPQAAMDSLCHPEDRALERSVRERIVREGGSGAMEIRLRDPRRAAWRHYRVHLRAGRRLPSGCYELYGLAQVITELARTRDESRANAERLRLALNAAKAGVFEIDYLAQSVRCSPEFEAVVGGALDYASLSSGAWAQLHGDDHLLLHRMKIGWNEPEGGFIDARVLKADREQWIRVYLDVARAGGEPAHAVGLVVDVDDQKRQELALLAAQRSAEAATMAKSKVLATVSHEIRTPMNGVVGVLHILKTEPLSDEGRRMLDEALACTGMLGQLINDVLDFSRIEAGKLELSPVPTDVAAALRGVADLVLPQAREKGLWLNLHVQPSLSPVGVDPVRLRQCLFNLIGNAVKFTLRGGVDVRLTWAGTERLRFEVQDTGVGVPEEAKGRLFQRFEQADEATTRNFSGTGLGLSIAKTLAQMMGGDIGFESTVGVGSTFWFEIAAPPAASAVPLVAEQAADQNVSLEGLRVLIVDDTASNRLVGTKILEALGAEAYSESDGQGALDALSQRRFDVVLMDINMPGMNGMEATRRIRSSSAPCCDTPIIALTANVMAQHRQAYIEAGVDGVVAKPFSPGSLMQEIVRVFQVLEERRRSPAEPPEQKMTVRRQA